MGLYRSVRAVTSASGEGAVDWAAVSTAAKAAVGRGDLSLSAADRDGYATDVGDARDRIRSVADVDVDLPEAVEVQNRHHWIDANVETFARMLRPLERDVDAFPTVGRVTNTGSMTVALSFLGNNVLGQYDPVLLAEADHSLYFVHPNIVRTAAALDVPLDRFRRWIAFHEVAHAAEFAAAPWLSDHLESLLEGTVTSLAEGTIDRDGLAEVDVAMTAVEGYAELLMDRAFDAEVRDLRRKLDQRRRNRGPIEALIRRLLGLGLKRRQYERGKEFFETVADVRGLTGAGAVWASPDHLPTGDELDHPERWLARVPA